MRKLLLVQGANMSRLGKRNPAFYGNRTPAELDAALIEYAAGIGFSLEVFYTNIEGEAINRIYDAVDNGSEGILMNPAGFTEGGFALRNCLREAGPPYIELHCQNPVGRGKHSVTGESATGTVAGFGPDSYFIALDAMKRLLSRNTA